MNFFLLNLFGIVFIKVPNIILLYIFNTFNVIGHARIMHLFLELRIKNRKFIFLNNAILQFVIYFY